MKKHCTLFLLITFIVNTLLPPSLMHVVHAQTVTQKVSPQPTPLLVRSGQSLTLLPDGQWLLLGGKGPDGPQAHASLWNPQSGRMTLLEPLLRARMGHSATVLPDGNVLIFGGIGSDQQVIEDAELFSPAQQTFTFLPNPGLTPRAYHTATVLTDGRVLVVGGLSQAGDTLSSAELWNPRTQTAELSPHALTTARHNHTAVLLPTGAVLLWGGHNATGREINSGEWYDPVAQTWTPLDTARTVVTSEGAGPQIVASIPTDSATNTPLDSVITLRFSVPMQVETVTPQTLLLQENGSTIQEAAVVAAEGGMLAFVLPQSGLQPSTAYTLTVQGPLDETGHALPITTLHFTTAPQDSTSLLIPKEAVAQSTVQRASAPAVTSDKNEQDSEEWIPDEATRRGDWNSRRTDPPEKSLPPLQAAPGVTALAGQVFSLGGRPLAGVMLSIDTKTTQTNDNGQFLLTDLPSGKQVLVIDGRKLDPGNRNYGLFEAQVEITAGQTTILPFTSWLPRIDQAHAVQIPSPTTMEVVVTTPHIPGLELHIPPGVTIQDHDGQPVTEVSITPIPVDRTPYPLPINVQVPIYFTIQPGGAEILGVTRETGARVIYPNYTNQAPGARANFWRYDPEGFGWSIYGMGTATPDGRQVMPDPGVTIYEFTGAMINNQWAPPPKGPPPCSSEQECCGKGKAGNPIDLATGLKVEEVTDLTLADVLPLRLTRTYRPSDTNIRPFGMGSTFNYAMFLWSANQYQEADLILPDGGRVHYVRTSAGTSFFNAVFEHAVAPCQFYKSHIVWNGAGWDLTLKDGTVYVFGENAPLQAIRDRHGNTTRLTWSNVNGGGSGWGNIVRVTSPNGRRLNLSYDTSNRVSQVTDSAGRTVGYSYDASGRLTQVTDAAGGVTQYTYDAANQLVSKRDPRGNTVYSLQYDATGKVTQETLADGGVYQFAYTVDANNKVTQVNVTDPRQIVRRVTFNSDGYVVADSHALGLPEQQTTTYTRLTGSNLIQSMTDALGRRADYIYDALGNRTSITRLAGTPQAVTTTYTYEPTFNQLASATDPLGHTATLDHDSQGNLIQITDPLGNHASLTYNPAGQLTSITDALGNTQQFTYHFGDLATITDPLSNTTTFLLNSTGRRLARAVNALGQTANYSYDALNRRTQATNAQGQATAFAYDPNGNRTSVTDAAGGITTYTYDAKNRTTTRKDPIQRTASFQYDGKDNVIQVTDQKALTSTVTYDGLNRRGQVTYADGSTKTYTFDVGNRLTQVVDSTAGAITRTYDGLNHLLSETTPQGTVNYTYDAAGRRTSMTVAGQATVNYTYDGDDRLIQITQGTATATFAYDATGRRTSLTLPNGVGVSYSYDAASRLTGLTYTKGATVLGDLTYAYNKIGRRIVVGGSFARTGLPQALSTGTYDAANQQLTLGNKSATFDANGNLATLTDSSGTTTYTWNARNQLAALTGPSVTASFQYDAFGRRVRKTVNGVTTDALYDRFNLV